MKVHGVTGMLLRREQRKQNLPLPLILSRELVKLSFILQRTTIVFASQKQELLSCLYLKQEKRVHGKKSK